jgi:hypothetical protein
MNLGGKIGIADRIPIDWDFWGQAGYYLPENE